MVLVAVAAVALAARSNPDPSPAPAPVVTPPPTTAAPAGPPPIVTGMAVGTRWAYALLSTCADADLMGDCTTQLVRRALAGGGWQPVGWRTRRLNGSVPQLFVTPDDQVTVLDAATAGQVYASTDGGRTRQVRGLRPGPPVAGIPAGGVLDLGLCEECSARLTALEPATGRLRPLATQPVFGRTVGIRFVARSGDTVWVLAESGEAGRDLLTAVSRDRGRSWRILPLPGTGTTTTWDSARIFSDGGTGAYVLLARDTRPDVLTEFTELWRIGDEGGWRRITPADRPPTAVQVVAGTGGALIGTEEGDAWRLRADGTVRKLPRADYDGVLIAPGAMASGPGGVVLGVPYIQSDLLRPTVVLSFDGGETWRVEELG